MKKLLAMTLALVLALGLCVPALADEVPATPTYTVEGEAAEALTQEELDALLESVPALPDLISPAAQEPTLTLVVNGVPSETVLTAENGATYADTADLRSILGENAVAIDVKGPVAVRAAAEAAGWDVVWYDGGWMGVDQEVCLFDKAAYTAELDKAFAPLRDFYAKVMDKALELWEDKEGFAETDTVDLTFTRFSTLDGNKTYTAKITAQTTLQAGVADMTVTFDVTDFLKLFTAEELKALTAEADFSLDSLTALLKGGKIELLMDMNTGSIAVNAPILGLIDPELAGWHAMTVPGLTLDAMKEMPELTELSGMLYDELLSSAENSGAPEAQMDYANTLAMFNAFFGPETLQIKDDGSMTFSLTTQRVNAIFGDLLAASIPSYQTSAEGQSVNLFKNYDLTMTIDADWNVKMDMEVRLDVDGIAAIATATGDGAEAALESMGMRILMSLIDFRVTGESKGDMKNSEGTVELHWNNQGSLKLESKAAVTKAKTAPRKPSDVVAPADFWDPTAGLDGSDASLGIIGGADGPTQVFTTVATGA